MHLLVSGSKIGGGGVADAALEASGVLVVVVGNGDSNGFFFPFYKRKFNNNC